MRGRKRRQVPPGLARARQRFEAWRRKRQVGTRIPQPLWALAVKLAADHGLHQTAAVLKLDYYALKKRREAANGQQQATEATFVELPTPLAAAKQCTFELDDGTGATMRVQLAGYDAADVVALGRSFWNVG